MDWTLFHKKQSAVSSPVVLQEQDAIAQDRAPHEKTACPITAKMGQDLYCASSILKSQKINKYGVASLLDDSNFTAWFEGNKGQGVGQWIVVDFGELRTVREIIVKNGYNKKEGLFYNNSRVRTLSLSFFRRTDTPNLLFSKTSLVNRFSKLLAIITARWVQLKILSVIKGQKYTDTGLNELRVLSRPLAK